MNDIFYYRIVEHHYKLLNCEIPLNIWQLMELLGCECNVEDYIKKVPNECLFYIPLREFVRFKTQNHLQVSEKSKQDYNWDSLVESIQRMGIVVPVIAERHFLDGFIEYETIEGKHRITAASLTTTCNANTLIPTLVVERDYCFTELMSSKSIHQKSIFEIPQK